MISLDTLSRSAARGKSIISRYDNIAVSLIGFSREIKSGYITEVHR